MTVPTLRQMMEAGMHFGHQTRRWNPKMKPYIHSDRHGLHIIDLKKTQGFLKTALQVVTDTVARGGRVLFVSTKSQAKDFVKQYAEQCGQYYVNHRWLGGMLTNWKTISRSIDRLKKLK